MSLRPTTAEELVEHVRAAVAEAAPLEIVGAGTKRGLGRPMQARETLDLSAFSGVSLYEPEELVMSAGAATPVATIEAMLAEQRQMLAFEPPDLAALWGSAAGAQTIGGVLSANLAGPRRIKAGAARDHFLGFEAVSGRGEAFKSGGRVVKNVTGYDLSKLIAGSHGTLAVMHAVTFKVLPAPEKTRTVLVHGLQPAAAVRALSAALGSPHEVSAAAHLPAAIAARSSVDLVRDPGTSITAVRIEGPAPSVEVRCAALRELLRAHEELHGMRSGKLWREVRDVAPLLSDPAAAIWRISVKPSDGPILADLLAPLKAEVYFDWGGGLLWLAGPVGGDAGARFVREKVDALGGHATLVRAPDAIRAAVPPFHPEAPGLAALARRVKDQFDPLRILNPGRIAADL